MVRSYIEEDYVRDVEAFNNILRTRLNLGLQQVGMVSMYSYMLDFVSRSGVYYILEVYPSKSRDIIVSVTSCQGNFRRNVMLSRVEIGKLSKSSAILKRIIQLIQS